MGLSFRSGVYYSLNELNCMFKQAIYLACLGLQLGSHMWKLIEVAISTQLGMCFVIVPMGLSFWTRSPMDLSKNATYHSCAKYIDVRYAIC